jgi:hypothetical protein
MDGRLEAEMALQKDHATVTTDHSLKIQRRNRAVEGKGACASGESVHGKASAASKFIKFPVVADVLAAQAIGISVCTIWAAANHAFRLLAGLAEPDSS